MRFHETLRSAAAAVATAALVFGTAPPAHALQHVTSCTSTCTANCVLDASLRCCNDAELCDGSGPITLSGGADLDMNGFSLDCFCGTLTCIGGSNNNVLCTTSSECPGGTCGNDTGCTSCGAAVNITSSGAVVKNNGGSESFISGPFSPAVSCNSNTTSRVEQITFTGISGTVLTNCAQVDQNVFYAGTGTATAVTTAGVAASDFIKNNYFNDWVKAISVTGNKSVEITNNLVALRYSDAQGTGGIDVSSATSTTLKVEDNIIQGTSSSPIIGNAVSVFNRNYCNPLNTNTYCATATPPFVMP